MWTKEILGTDVLHLTQAFIMYSMLGWLVESVYMSFCNKKLTNRGFATCPMCPIYGFGGVIGYMVLHPLSDHKVALYIAGAILATTFEYLVARLMEKTLGEVWWDYSEKPLNYRGVICAESTLAWGVYAIVVVCYLQNFLMRTVDRIPTRFSILSCRVIIAIYLFDFVYHLALALGVNMRGYWDRAKETYRSFRARW
ncbi:MAG: putative ABC transporter permease [Lachnospiraceae bacterium]|nr:putative ABC transporter permease [Lachnospiraceae bacterium]